jgi:DNA-binding CsgD family transcriptional regulator
VPLLLEQIDRLETYYITRIEKSMLSKRESVILNKLLKGESKRDISQSIGISYYTLKRHLQSLREKAEVKSTQELIKKYNRYKKTEAICRKSKDRISV